MITQIGKLKKFGIFKDYVPSAHLKEFNKFNLIYGFNGSGKSTLAKLYFSIEDRKIHSHFTTSEFAITAKDHEIITHKNIDKNLINIRVFNQDFIDRNVNFELSTAASIIILSEEKKEEMKAYKASLELYNQKKLKLTSDIKERENDEDLLKKSLSRWASNIKKSFELIETNQNYYLNYDRTKLGAFIKANRVKICKENILLNEQVQDLKKAIKPTRKNDIPCEVLSVFKTEEINELFKELEHVLSSNIFSAKIDRLLYNTDINQWVQDGLAIHSSHDSSLCEYCGQKIPQQRVQELNQHFNQEYNDLIRRLAKLEEGFANLNLKINCRLPDAIELYDEFHAEFLREKDLYVSVQEICIAMSNNAIANLTDKLANPFIGNSTRFLGVTQLFENYNSKINRLSSIILKHNSKNLKFQDEVKNAQSLLELHFVSDLIISESYFDSEESIKQKRAGIVKLEAEIEALLAEVKGFETVLISETVGAEEFNRNLSKFIGRKDISIQFNSELKGYNLIRDGKAQPAVNLSEGEKTAIAFVYFVSKLKENGNKIENTIVLVDDPISSFDSNHLFCSFSFLKQECETAMQLFVFTHNFQYFKLVRDWLVKKNDKSKTRAHFYSVDSTNEENRASTLNNANDTLVKFNSEYHYVFHKLYTFKELASLDIEKAFLVANLARKLLEGFLTFKFPKGRNDFNQLLQAGCPDGLTREKVYRFINKYSHNQVIEFHDGPVDNLVGEGDNIIGAIFKIVSDLDNKHFLEMEEVCTSGT